MHIFPQLRKLEEKYQEELVVVGVHSAKFTSEKDTANIEKAIRRLELEHPVVNDKDFPGVEPVLGEGMADALRSRP